jgi:hypothetical protein
VNRRDDDVFADLIRREFPDGLDPRTAVGAPDPWDVDPQPDLGPAPIAPLSDFRAWSPDEEPEEEEFEPPPAPLARPWTLQARIGTGLLLLGLVMVIVSGSGVQLPMIVAVLTGAGVFAGAALLLHRLHQRPPTDGDGAVL